MPHITANNINLYYEVHGEGMPLLLIAGLASDSQSWQPIIKELSGHYQVIVFDNRCVGRTHPQDIEISIQDIADDCVALIRRLKLSSVNILGHSMGGFVALDCAIRYSDYVSNLILAGTSAFNSERNNSLFHDWSSYLESGMPPELWFRNIFYWIFSKSFFENEEMLNNSIRLAIEYPYPQTKSSFKNQVIAIKSFNRSGDLRSIAAKTLITYGREDLLFPPEECVKVLKEIPNTVVSVIEHAAHSIHMEKPKHFLDAVLTFLEQP